ncbi:hypothetical protein [Nitrosomonas sp. Nm166]|uniref:hypothetical protein n=1 Tax=Nitrosomonas sp. Nm166 TaxID=1881054 RepID=UPI000B87C683|nr:hypothetical protein [Nitrosomonas sp. Nm166]
MKREAHGTQHRDISNQIDEEASTAQRSDSPVQSINQHFPNLESNVGFILLRNTLLLSIAVIFNEA